MTDELVVQWGGKSTCCWLSCVATKPKLIVWFVRKSKINFDLNSLDFQLKIYFFTIRVVHKKFKIFFKLILSLSSLLCNSRVCFLEVSVLDQIYKFNFATRSGLIGSFQRGYSQINLNICNWKIVELILKRKKKRETRSRSKFPNVTRGKDSIRSQHVSTC